ncbi:calcium-binding protein [Nocardioides sp. LHG3406-4]|uniref:calcium-binding protein n=1 Tax=Nocardioides sp. LHG3406-4 TaxID=2804575 RepID=UPI003CF31F44
MRTLTTLAAAVVLPLGLLASVGAPAQAVGETCDGRAATIVVVLPAGAHFTEPMVGTAGDDVIVGSEGDDAIDGAGGNDVVCGLAGADTLVGGAGDDRLFGGADDEYAPDDGYYGDLLVPGAGDDHVDLGTGEERIWFWESDLEVDQVSYADAPTGVRVDLAAGTAVGHGTDTIVTGATGRPIGVIGSAHDDTLLGSSGRDVIDAGAGDDTIMTGDGADVVRPDHPGRTTSGWRMGGEAPAPEPQPGDDRVSTGPGSDGVWVLRGADVVRGGADVDRLTSDSPEPGTRLLGGAGKDRLVGSGGSTLLGQSGNDGLDGTVGGAQASTWDGGGGRDSLTVTVPRGEDLVRLLFDVPARRVTGDGTRLASLVRVERFGGYGRIGLATFVGGRTGERFGSSARRVRAMGGGGSDWLDGTRGAGLLDGGPGRDRLDGNSGRDRCLRGERLQRCEVRR